MHESLQEKKEEDDRTVDVIIPAKGQQKIALDNLSIKPPLTGKKTIGTLEVQCNGLRYITNKNAKIDILWKNVEH